MGQYSSSTAFFSQLRQGLVLRSDEVQGAVEAVKESMQDRIFPSTGPTRTAGGGSFRYRPGRIYVSIDAEPPPPGKATRGGMGKSVAFSDGWGAGSDSYRGALGLQITEINLQLTGRTRDAMTSRMESPKVGVIFFQGEREERAALLNERYGFFEFSRVDRLIWNERIQQLVDEKIRTLNQ